jgi:hypothetical protein
MAYEIKDNTGSIFANDKKVADTDPDGKGTAKIDGVEYWVSSWNNTAKDGRPYRKMSFKRKEAKADHQNERPAVRKSSADMGREMDDEIPF